MSDFIISGAVASGNRDTPASVPEFSSIDITVTLVITGTIVFPVTLTAQTTSAQSTTITWTQNIGPIDFPAPAPIEFITTATATNVLQARDLISQNYIVTVTDDDARTQVFNVAIDNEDGYPTAELLVVPGYPNPSGQVSTAGAPTGLSATAIGPTQIDLVWVAPVNTGNGPILGYQIQRETPIGGGFNVLITDTGNMLTSFSDTAVVSATQYNYRVAAINAAGLGLLSDEADDTTP